MILRSNFLLFFFVSTVPPFLRDDYIRYNTKPSRSFVYSLSTKTITRLKATNTGADPKTFERQCTCLEVYNYSPRDAGNADQTMWRISPVTTVYELSSVSSILIVSPIKTNGATGRESWRGALRYRVCINASRAIEISRIRAKHTLRPGRAFGPRRF